ncbi:hypothetical protein JCM8097_001493 [Rhodosporidiobolus ruineniae]
MLASLALPALFASAVLAHSGPARLDHLAALQKRQSADSSILSAYATAVSSALSPSSTSTSSSSSSASDEGSDQTGQSYLPVIVAAGEGTQCTTQTDAVTRAVAGCLAAYQTEQVQAVACACSDSVLGITETAANCIVSDAGNTNGTAPLENYNGSSRFLAFPGPPALAETPLRAAFVNQCISLDLANSTALASISGIVVTTATPTTTLLVSSTSSASLSFNGTLASATNATSIAEATGSVSSAASSQVVTSQVTTTVAPSPSATGAAGKMGVAVGAMAVVAGAMGFLA